MNSFIAAFACSALTLIWSAVPAQAQVEREHKFKAIAFDAFPVFDPRPIARMAEEIFPGHGSELIHAWRTRQFEYQWLRALSGQYEDFMRATEDALDFAARQTGLDVDDERKRRLLSIHLTLPVWPDAEQSIRTLKGAGLRLVFLSNMTEPMLRNGLERAGLSEHFEAIYSTDVIRTYKPAPAAYQLAMDQLGLAREDILFVAFAGWDAAGAKWFGYPTFWVNRTGAPMEVLGAVPDAEGPDLQALLDYLSLGTDVSAHAQDRASAVIEAKPSSVDAR